MFVYSGWARIKFWTETYVGFVVCVDGSSLSLSLSLSIERFENSFSLYENGIVVIVEGGAGGRFHLRRVYDHFRLLTSAPVRWYHKRYLLFER